MKKLFVLFWFILPAWAIAQVEVTYELTYDSTSQVYTVIMTCDNSYTNPLSRLASSTQVTVVVPQIPGGWQVTNLTDSTSLQWGSDFLDGSTLSLNKDYLFFSPQNAGTYTPFSIDAGLPIALFSFQSGTGCEGDLSLYENGSDPLDAVPTINAENNMVILGAGPGNIWQSNNSNTVSCQSLPVNGCEANAGTLGY
jgi:hypothetical protein